MAPDECENCCMTCVCVSVGCLCVCSNAKNATRIKVLWGWLLVLFLTSCVILGCFIYAPDTPLAAPSDMRPVTKNVDFLFCEAVLIDSPGLSFDAYRASGDLLIDKRKRDIKHFNTALFVETNSYNYFSFYFLDGSHIKIDHCSKYQVIFYVFNGQTNFNTWKKDSHCEECYLEKIYVPRSEDCTYKSDYQQFDLDIGGEDEWFFVYSTDETAQTWIDTDITLNRSLYDLRNATLICLDVLDCNVLLENPKDTAVFQVNDYYDLGNFNHPQFTTKCIPRIWSYLLIHSAIVLVVGISCSVFIQKLCKNPADRYMNALANERTPLLYEPIPPPNYSSVILTPPKYEDIMRYSDPPSYTEAIHALSRNRETGSESSDIPRTSSVTSDAVPESAVLCDNATNEHAWYIDSTQGIPHNNTVNDTPEQSHSFSINGTSITDDAEQTTVSSSHRSNAQLDVSISHRSNAQGDVSSSHRSNAQGDVSSSHRITINDDAFRESSVTQDNCLVNAASESAGIHLSHSRERWDANDSNFVSIDITC